MFSSLVPIYRMRPNFYEWIHTEAGGVDFTDDPAMVQSRLPMGTSDERSAITDRVAQGAQDYVTAMKDRVTQLEAFIKQMGIDPPPPGASPEPPRPPAIAA